MLLLLLNVMTPALAAAQVWSSEERAAAIIRPLTGIAVALLVHWLVRRTPWPRPFRIRFLLLHAAAGVGAAFLWNTAANAVVSIVLRTPFSLEFVGEYLAIGGTFYVIIVGISYAVEGSSRAARAEALAARTQLAALRAQIHPHFLFNALHTVVQLIPADPARAMEAAELVAGLLRTSIEEQRDEVLLDDEWRFVSRYLAVEQIRFGNRLVIRADIPPALLDERVPSFALQTLVENAVRHGAAPRVAPTEIAVTAVDGASDLTLTVRNTGDARPHALVEGEGTGLTRLRERLAMLYGGAARLSARALDAGGFEAVLVVPRLRSQRA